MAKEKLNRYELARQYSVHEDVARTICRVFNEDEEKVKECLGNKESYLKICREEKWKKQLSPEDFEFAKTLPESEAKQFVRKKSLERKYGSLESFYKDQEAKRKSTLQKRYGRTSTNPRKRSIKLPKEKTAKLSLHKLSREEKIVAKWGSVENYNLQRKLKIKQTKLERYGDENYSNQEQALKTRRNFSEEKKQEIKNKKTRTLIERFGEDFNQVLKSRREQACLEKYGVKNPMQYPQISEKAKNNQNEKYGKHRDSIIAKGSETKLKKYGVKCNFQSFDFKQKYPGHVTAGEKELQEFLSSLHVDYKTSCRDQIRTGDHIFELDIFVPSKNVAIEYNGLYWHCEVHKPVNYHQLKSDLCREKGIRLIHIFGDDWRYKKDICKSIIKASLGIYERRIFARKCQVQDIDASTYKQFLEENHIQGAVQSSIRKGLFHQGELIQVIGLGKSRFKKDEVELHRMCTKVNTQVLGGFSKLLKSVTGVEELITYVDLALFDGKGYESIGFEFLSKTKPNYWYLDRGANSRISRQKCQKHRLKNILGESFDARLTEVQNMHNAGYFRIFDSGTLKLRYVYIE